MGRLELVGGRGLPRMLGLMGFEAKGGRFREERAVGLDSWFLGRGKAGHLGF